MREWLRALWGAVSPPAPVEERVFVKGLPVERIVEALARQRALAEQRLRRNQTDYRQLEEGRRMATIEVAKELGIHDDVTARTYELRKRR